ncbi:MAG TPA: hypothetical protein V6C88_20405 [Chroococcidiopsis sp.]
MTPAEIEATLEAAFAQCEVAGLPLDDEQKQVLLRAAIAFAGQQQTTDEQTPSTDGLNPLDDLTPAQRQAFLQFVDDQNRAGLSWKAKLLNDWLQGQDSGPIQFIRETYGIQWLDQVQPIHLSKYAECTASLKVGDRIEVSNGLWEWVQDDGPCEREWFPCTVISLVDSAATLRSPEPENREPENPAPETRLELENSSAGDRQTRCIVRFDNGMEYEIQGVYEWNRYNWRWL